MILLLQFWHHIHKIKSFCNQLITIFVIILIIFIFLHIDPWWNYLSIMIRIGSLIFFCKRKLFNCYDFLSITLLMSRCLCILPLLRLFLMLFGLFYPRSMIFLCLCFHSCVKEWTDEQLLSLFSITHLQKNSFRMISNVIIKRVGGQENSILVLHKYHVYEFGKLFL